LPLWQTRLFTALVRSSNWQTGQGETTYATLIAMLTPLHPGRGPRHYVPDRDALKRALRRFAAVGLLRRNADTNQRGERLFFELDSRQAKVRPLFESAPGIRPPPGRLES